LTEYGKIAEPIFDGDLFDLTPGSRYIISAGSVGQPRDDNREAGYRIYNTINQQIIKRHITYPAILTIEKINAVGSPAANGLRLLPQ
jgi:diadenosine tetraphosphatase ApaH/serine/threonine PP2A family protein phosphatase